MKPSIHPHPKPTVDRLSQSVSLLGAVILWLSIPALTVGVLASGAPAGFLLALPVMFSLSLPLWMRTTIAPAVEINADGLILRPLFMKQRTIAWDEVAAVKLFPLLPSEDAEVTRRFVVGRRKYRPAAGIMLIVPGLPFPYRVGGLFAGTGAQPIIALTNRAHADYERLYRAVLEMTDANGHDVALYDA